MTACTSGYFHTSRRTDKTDNFIEYVVLGFEFGFIYRLLTFNLKYASMFLAIRQNPRIIDHSNN